MYGLYYHIKMTYNRKMCNYLDDGPPVPSYPRCVAPRGSAWLPGL